MILEILSRPAGRKGTDLTLINYLHQHLDTADTLTIKNLAENTCTSPATVSRFCTRVFGMGFREFRIQLIRELNEKGNEKVIDYDLPFSFTDSLNTIGANIASIKEKALKDTAAVLNYDSLLHLITMLRKSRRIFIFGKGESWLCAEIFRARLMKLNLYAINGEEYSFTAYNMANLTSEDMALFITYSGNHKGYNSYIPMLNSRHVHTAVITANAASTLSQNAQDQILIPHIESNDEKIASFASTEELNYVLEVIYAGLFRYNYTRNINDRLKKEKYTTSVMLDDNGY